jgi:cytoskeleton protein RodZ
MDEPVAAENSLFQERVGEKLRAARLKAGIDLSDIATRTRIPLRHLTAIEASDYDALPTNTYSMGFVRSYARAVGEDEVALAAKLREELGMVSQDSSVENVDYDAADPARVPSKTLALIALALAVLIGGGYALWRQGSFESDINVVASAALEGEEVLNESANGAVAGNSVATPVGQVVLTATDKVWLRVYDRNNKVFIGKEMQAGESFAVPVDADNPMIRTTLPHKIKITIGGKDVAPLGAEEKLIKDVGVSAAALNARAATAAAAGGAASNALSGAVRP